jgi:hypothetical protein
MGGLLLDQMFVELYARHVRILVVETDTHCVGQIFLERWEGFQPAHCKPVLVESVLRAHACLVGNLNSESLSQHLQLFSIVIGPTWVV